MVFTFNPHTLLPITCFILSLIIGIFVLFKNSKAPLNRIFFFLCIDIAAWMSFYIPFNFNASEQLILTWFRISYCFISFIPIMTFTFVTTYLEAPKNTIWYRINSIIGLIFCILSVTTDWIIQGINYLPWYPFPKAGVLHIFLVAHCGYLAFYSVKLMLDIIPLNEHNPKKANNLKYMSFGIIILAFGMIDFISNYGPQIYTIGYISSSLFLLTVSAAIIKHQLMDIQIALRKGLVYSFLVSLITLIYVAIILIIERVFLHNNSYQTLPGFLTACLIAIIFTPLRNFLQNFVDKLIFKNSTSNIAEENALLRQEITQTERLKSVAILASGMAHEIKNPLTALKTISEYLPKKGSDPEFLKKFAPIMAQEVDRIDNLVHDLLEFAKPAPVQLKKNNIHQLLNNTIDILNNDLIKNKIKLTKNYLASPDLTLNIDANQFKQALLNIILNAIDAMPNAGELTITTDAAESDNSILIKIQDTGTGIAKEDLAHIFDPFFTKKDKGTGLGLSITHEIIKNHNGKIFVESSLGMGTTFIIELP